MPLEWEADEIAQAGGAEGVIHGVDIDGNVVQVYFSAASAPTVDNDNVDTAGLGEVFHDGNIWVKLDTNDRWQLDDGAAGAAVWSPMGGGGGGIIAETNQTISEDYTLTAGMNGHSVGPVTIDTGFSVTIPAGARWLIS